MMRIGLDLAVNDPPERFGRVVRAVERGGFQALWLVDNGLWGRDLFVHLGWAAVATRHVRLGPGVTHPMIRHPGVIANSLATLDELSHRPGSPRTELRRSVGRPRARLRAGPPRPDARDLPGRAAAPPWGDPD